MDLEQVLKQMQGSAQEKTASTSPQTTDAKLQGALAAAVEKTAAAVTPAPATAGDPIQDLLKVAETIAGSEKEAELAHAAMLGTMFAEAAVAKFAAFDAQVKIAAAQEAQTQRSAAPNEQLLKAAAEAGYREAMQQVAAAQEQEKMAGASDDELVKMAAEQGYQDTMEKIAVEQYKAGHDTAMQEVHQVAMGEFLKGAAETEMLLNALQK